ncbi:MAG: UDP-N-acetylmuramoyl-L-alanyl-D-glutamate--2,6-diaminopimelate ligase [Desulfovibrionaceae bacterium]
MPHMTFEELKELVRAGLMVRSHSGAVRPGEVFVAVPGAQVDGAAYIPQALAKGAAFVVARGEAAMPSGATATLVEHPEPGEALGELAAAYFHNDTANVPVIGVTGTNGKTTTTYLLEHLLRENGRKVGVIGTVTYRWPGFSLEASMTTPDSWKLHELIANMVAGGVDVVVMEVSSHALDQHRVGGLDFRAGVLTNVTQDHLDYHKTMDGYFRAKAMLFHKLKANGHVGVINWDDDYGRVLLSSHAPAMGYGLWSENPGREFGADGLRGEIVSCTGQGLTLRMTHGEESWEITSPLIGAFNASNLLATQAVGLSMGLKPRHMQCLATCAGVPGRLERVANNKDMHVFVDYAHTPDALENVLSTLRDLDFKRILTVFGCGGDRDRGKRPLMGAAVAKYADIVFLTSDNPRSEDPERIMDDVMPGLAMCDDVVREADRRIAIRSALARLRPGDVLLVAGKGHESTQQIGTEKFPFSDQQVVREILG